MKKILFRQNRKSAFCRRARALQNCSRPHFSEMHKNWSKKFIFHQVGFCPWIPSLLQRSTFLPSFYAFPKNVVLDNFVELELFYKTHFSDFAGTKSFSSTLTILHFRFNTKCRGALKHDFCKNRPFDGTVGKIFFKIFSRICSLWCETTENAKIFGRWPSKTRPLNHFMTPS